MVLALVSKEGEADSEVIEVVWVAEVLTDGDVVRSEKGFAVAVLEVEWSTSALARCLVKKMMRHQGRTRTWWRGGDGSGKDGLMERRPQHSSARGGGSSTSRHGWRQSMMWTTMRKRRWTWRTLSLWQGDA